MNVLKLMSRKRNKYRFTVKTMLFMKDKDPQMNSRMYRLVFTSNF